jgi:ketosteroid isomerase-like protein
MKQAAALFCAAVALAAFSIESLAAGSSKEVAALEAVDRNWEKAFSTANADALAAFYDESAVLLPPGAPAVHGRAAIKAFLAKEAADAQKAGISFTLGAKPAGGVSGNMGWQSGTYVVKDKTGKVLETGKYLSVSEKKGGKWLYVRDTWYADGAPPTDSAAPAKK